MTNPVALARKPLSTAEKVAYTQRQQDRPRCASCPQPLLLIQPGRDRCERCQPTDWRILTGRAPANPRGANPPPTQHTQLTSVRKRPPTQ